MTLIRVLRDDNFLKQMLVLIRRFYTSYVRQRKPPPEDMFYQRNDYQVSRTSLASVQQAGLFSPDKPCLKLLCIPKCMMTQTLGNAK